MANIPLEDNFTDIVGKAQRGLGVNDEELCKRTGVAAAALAQFKSGNFDSAMAQKIATALDLGAKALIELGQKAWYPEPHEALGLACFNTTYQDSDRQFLPGL